jgi:hypothetical protein
MFSQTFLYFIGQNIAWLLSSWIKSLVVCALLFLVTICVSTDYTTQALTVFVGWASVVVVPEFILKVTHMTFDDHIKHQLLPLLVLVDALVFALFTTVVNANDASPVIWVILIPAHVLYAWLIYQANALAKRVQDFRIYFATYALVLVANDMFFLIVSLIIHGHPLNFISVVIAGVLTGIPLLFASSTVFTQWVEKHSVAPAARPIELEEQ